MLGGEQVIPPLALDMRHDSLDVIIAEEAVENGGVVEARDDQATDVRHGTHPRRTLPLRATHGRGIGVAGVGIEVEGGAIVGLCGEDWMGLPLAGETDVDQGADSLSGGFVLGVIEEEALAGLVGGMPGEDVKVEGVDAVDGVVVVDGVDAVLGGGTGHVVVIVVGVVHGVHPGELLSAKLLLLLWDIMMEVIRGPRLCIHIHIHIHIGVGMATRNRIRVGMGGGIGKMRIRRWKSRAHGCLLWWFTRW